MSVNAANQSGSSTTDNGETEVAGCGNGTSNKGDYASTPVSNRRAAIMQSVVNFGVWETDSPLRCNMNIYYLARISN